MSNDYFELAGRGSPEGRGSLKKYWQCKRFTPATHILRRHGSKFKGLTHLETPSERSTQRNKRQRLEAANRFKLSIFMRRALGGEEESLTGICGISLGTG